MLKTVLIDDERLALRGLEYMLKKYEKIQIVAMFTNPMEAIDAVEAIKPDIVFLDISMPQAHGIDVASAILARYNKTEIVFITAYNQYAIEAFEINALDYLLKPVSLERLDKTINRLLVQHTEFKKVEKQLHIRFFGGFHLFWEDEYNIKWRTEKNKELFLFLVENRNRSISKYEILDKLWSEDDPERSVKQLYNGIYYIRKNLTNYGIESEHINIDGNYKLTLGKVCFDVDRFNILRGKIDILTPEETKELIDCLRGEYLEGYYYLWTEIERDKYNRLHENVAVRLAKKFIKEGQYKRAEELLLDFFKKNKYNEEIVSVLIQLYKEQKLFSNAHIIYNDYKKSIGDDLALEPSEEIEKLIEK